MLDLYCAPGDSLDGADFADAVSVAELLTSVLLAVGPDGRIPESLGPWWNQPLATREVHQAATRLCGMTVPDSPNTY